jgi:hypothetical protein
MILVLFIVVFPNDLLIWLGRGSEGDGDSVEYLFHEFRFEFSRFGWLGSKMKRIFPEFGSEDRVESGGCHGRERVGVDLVGDYTVLFCPISLDRTVVHQTDQEH